MESIAGKVCKLQRLYGRNNKHYSSASIETKEKKKVRVCFYDRELYHMACDAHGLGADIIIEYDTILAKIPFTVVCKTAKIAK